VVHMIMYVLVLGCGTYDNVCAGVGLWYI